MIVVATSIVISAKSRHLALLSLQEDDELHFHGHVLLALVSSSDKLSVSINGYVLPSQSTSITEYSLYPCYSPVSHALFSITCHQAGLQQRGPTERTSQFVDVAHVQALIKQIPSGHVYDALLLVASAIDSDPLFKLASSIHQFATPHLGPNKLQIEPTFTSTFNTTRTTNDSASCLAFNTALIRQLNIPHFYPVHYTHLSEQTLPSSVTLHNIPQLWLPLFQDILNSNTTPIILVVGAKSTGKSSLCRHLINLFLSHRLSLSHIDFMDLDPGQPELTEPGLISLNQLRNPLLSPPPFSAPCSSYPNLPLQYFTGATSPAVDPVSYLFNVKRLFEHYSFTSPNAFRLFPPSPLIINTMGWIKGLGRDLLSAIITTTQPTHILHLYSSTSSNVVDQDFLAFLSTTITKTLSHLPIIIPLGSFTHPSLSSPPSSLATTTHLRTLTAVDRRHLALLTSFTDSSYTIRPLNHPSMTTYIVPICLFDIYFLHDDIHPFDTLRALNGTLVSLSHAPSLTLPDTNTTTPTTTTTIDTNYLTTHTHLATALIRACSSTHFYISTSLSSRQLSLVNLIIRGNIQLPPWFLLPSSSSSAPSHRFKHTQPHPYRTTHLTAGIGAESTSLRHGLLRKSHILQQ